MTDKRSKAALRRRIAELTSELNGQVEQRIATGRDVCSLRDEYSLAVKSLAAMTRDYKQASAESVESYAKAKALAAEVAGLKTSVAAREADIQGLARERREAEAIVDRLCRFADAADVLVRDPGHGSMSRTCGETLGRLFDLCETGRERQ